MKRRSLVFSGLLALSSVGLFAGPGPSFEDWPQWRGPNLNGVSDSARAPITWSEEKNIKWKVKLPAWSGSTPIVQGDRVFMTSPSKPTESDTAPVGRSLRQQAVREGGGSKVELFCFARETGKLLWTSPISTGNRLFGKHNMASPSAVADADHVYAMSGTGVVGAYGFSGKNVWSRDLVEENGEFGLYWGYGSSPLLYDGKVVVQVLHGATTKKPSYLIALDTRTGKTVWKVERTTDAIAECPDAYTTPTVLQRGGKDEIVISGADYVTGHNPATGEEIWRVGGLNPQKARNYRICGSPVVVGDMLFAPSRRKPLLGLRCGSEGAPEISWAYGKGPDVPTPVSDGKYLYVVDDRGVATALDCASGDVVWGPERIARGTYSSSPVLASGRIYVTNEDCVTTIFKAGSEFEIVAENELSGGYTISSLAIADGEIFLRSADALYCISGS